MHARLLHLIDPPRCAWPAMELLGGVLSADRDGRRHEVLIVGGSSADESARQFGIASEDRISPPLGKPWLARRAVERFIASRGVPDAIVAWSDETAVLGALVTDFPLIAVMSLPPPMFDGSVRWIPLGRALLGAALVVYPSAFLRDSWIARFTLLGCPAVVIPPMPRTPPDPIEVRRSLRREWEIEDGTLAISGLGEPVSEIDAHAAVFAAGVLGVAGRNVVVVVHPESAHIDRALRFAASIRPRRRVIVDDRPAHFIMPGLDLALWSEPESVRLPRIGSRYTTPLGAVSLAAAAAARVPIVAHEHPCWRSVLGNGAVVTTVTDRTRLRLTKAILETLKAKSRDEVRAPGAGPTWSERFERQVAEVCRERTLALVSVQ